LLFYVIIFDNEFLKQTWIWFANSC